MKKKLSSATRTIDQDIFASKIFRLDHVNVRVPLIK